MTKKDSLKVPSMDEERFPKPKSKMYDNNNDKDFEKEQETMMNNRMSRLPN